GRCASAPAQWANSAQEKSRIGPPSRARPVSDCAGWLPARRNGVPAQREPCGRVRWPAAASSLTPLNGPPARIIVGQTGRAAPAPGAVWISEDLALDVAEAWRAHRLAGL